MILCIGQWIRRRFCTESVRSLPIRRGGTEEGARDPVQYAALTAEFNEKNAPAGAGPGFSFVSARLRGVRPGHRREDDGIAVGNKIAIGMPLPGAG